MSGVSRITENINISISLKPPEATVEVIPKRDAYISKLPSIVTKKIFRKLDYESLYNVSKSYIHWKKTINKDPYLNRRLKKYEDFTNDCDFINVQFINKEKNKLMNRIQLMFPGVTLPRFVTTSRGGLQLFRPFPRPGEPQNQARKNPNRFDLRKVEQILLIRRTEAMLAEIERELKK